jgi:hypothetical protein
VREAIERVIAELEHEHKRQWELERKARSHNEQWFRQGGLDGLTFAINKLKEVLTHEKP